MTTYEVRAVNNESGQWERVGEPHMDRVSADRAMYRTLRRSALYAPETLTVVTVRDGATFV